MCSVLDIYPTLTNHSSRSRVSGKDTPKVIKAVGHTSKVTLHVRSSDAPKSTPRTVTKKQQEKSSVKPKAEKQEEPAVKRAVVRKRKHLNVEDGEEQPEVRNTR